MNHQATAAAATQAGASGAAISFNKNNQLGVGVGVGVSTSGVSDMLQSLYKQMRESRHSGEAATFGMGGGWANFAGHGALGGR